MALLPEKPAVFPETPVQYSIAGIGYTLAQFLP
jgi:hypothetical protein